MSTALVGSVPFFAAASDGAPPLDEQRQLDAMQEAIGRYEQATKAYRGTISHVVKQEYEKKRKQLQERYDASIKWTEREEREHRKRAISLFENFLRKYPTDHRWTPDTIFRLAELYFEQSNEEYLVAVDAAQRAAEGSKEGAAAPVMPNYQRTIDLYKRLLTEFPTYRLIDGAHYLLGYCLGEMGKEPEARQAYLGLVCKNQYKALDAAPQSPAKGRAAPAINPYQDCQAINDASRFVPEAWTRVGEYHFDYNELDLAVAAYSRVLKYKDSPYYDKALYKLAWSFYRADKYPEAIKKFDELVAFSDAAKSTSGKEGSDLRQEAIQYLGISFAEKDWNGDQLDDPESGLQRLETAYHGRDKELHVREVFQKLGDIYFDQTEYVRAIEVYKKLLAKWPYASESPKVQDRVVTSLERMRNFEGALKERELLARTYSKNSDWYKQNRDNKEAIDVALELAEQSLLKYAVDHHRAAQSLKKLAMATTPPDGKRLDLASKEYGLAADAYAKYLEQYPGTKNIYEYTFFFAESLYFSTRLADAAVQYERVRDSNLDNKYLEDSAVNVIKAYENLLEGEVKSGKLTLPPLPTPGKVVLPIQPLTIPPEVKKLQGAYDAYIKKLPTGARAATMAYKAAEIDFKYLGFDPARGRLATIIDKYCKDNTATEAGRAIVLSYKIENNLDKIAEWSERILRNTCMTKDEGIGTTFHDARFAIAERLLTQKKFEEAANSFLKLVDGDPTNKSGTNDKALNNAAVAYENINRFAAATKLYERIVNEYPKSTFVDDALFRTADNYRKWFEFEKAVVSYQRLAADPRFKESKYRLDALYNAAIILENDQAYDQAATLFQQYATEPTVKKEDQLEAFFHSATIYLKTKDPAKILRAFRSYLKNAPTDPKRTLEASFRIAEALDQQKNSAEALQEYRKVVAMGGSVPAASDAAEFPAHAAFNLAEQQLFDLQKLKISGDLKTFQNSYKKFKDQIGVLTGEYNKVIAYRRVTWTLAAYFRIGYLYDLLSKALASVLQQPCPAEIMKKYKQEGCDVYAEQVSKAIEPLIAAVDEEVVKRYRTTLDQAAKLGVANEWTKLARLKANAYKPDEFPMVKDERVDFQLENPL